MNPPIRLHLLAVGFMASAVSLAVTTSQSYLAQVAPMDTLRPMAPTAVTVPQPTTRQAEETTTQTRTEEHEDILQVDQGERRTETQQRRNGGK